MSKLESHGLKWQNLIAYESAECLNLQENVAFQFMKRACCRGSKKFSAWRDDTFVQFSAICKGTDKPRPVYYTEDVDDVLKKRHAIDGMSRVVGTDVSQIVLGDQYQYFGEFLREVESYLEPFRDDLWLISDLVELCARDNGLWWDRKHMFGSIALIWNESFPNFVRFRSAVEEIPHPSVHVMSRCMPKRYDVLAYMKVL
jgi:hypothetical protein